ncbi:ATP-binding protein [Streptomyces sp. B6B3]|uniref:caspase, EACC1-associated type n=1 Tax=Streptomyces sp. B6B3 TaxID=3153570 RepID=UPI00325C4678
MSGLPDRERSRVVLVGASRFTELTDLPAVAANVAVLRELFTAEGMWELPEDHCVVVREPHAAPAVSHAIRLAARDASDTLVFYYAGHGLIDPGTGELYLAVRDSHPQEVYDTAVPYEWVRRALLTSPAARRIVVLDCCYSGRMLGSMSEGLGLAEIDGTYLLAATAENAVALAPPGERHTAFTGELIEVLRGGVPGAGETLTLNEVFGAVGSALQAANRPQPQCRDRNALGTVPFTPNHAYLPPAEPVRTSVDPTLRRFLADMAHELRTPLTAITAVTDVLAEEAERLDPQFRPSVRLVSNEAHRLNEIVEGLMDLARIDAGLATVAPEEVEITARVGALIRAQEPRDTVTLRAPHLIQAYLDPRRLDLVVAHLVTNALKHGAPPVTVTVAPRPDEDFEITVADSGRGIPEDALPLIFQRFFRAESPRPRSQGSGLGLSIAQENAHLMGGSIRAANRQTGSEFTVRLPCRAATHHP